MLFPTRGPVQKSEILRHGVSQGAALTSALSRRTTRVATAWVGIPRADLAVLVPDYMFYATPYGHISTLGLRFRLRIGSVGRAGTAFNLVLSLAVLEVSLDVALRHYTVLSHCGVQERCLLNVAISLSCPAHHTLVWHGALPMALAPHSRRDDSELLITTEVRQQGW